MSEWAGLATRGEGEEVGLVREGDKLALLCEGISLTRLGTEEAAWGGREGEERACAEDDDDEEY